MTLKSAIYLVIALTFTSLSGHAQSAIDALRYNSNYQIGSARNIGLGGSIGSMGGDLSVLSTNPAGIARFKSTEFQISPSVAFGNTTGDFLGNSLEDNYLNFNISSAGIAFGKVKRETNWKSFSAAFGINRLNQYDDNIFLSGTNTNNSLLDLHAAVAQGVDTNSIVDFYVFDAGLTYLGEVLLSDSTGSNYTSILGGVSPEQDITISRSGGKYEASFSAGGNYEDKIYIGGSIGIPIINFNETEIIAERDADNEVEGFTEFDVRNELRSTGYGVNFKFGILGVPHENVRIGAAFHSPSLINFTDQYYTVVNTDQYEVESPNGEFSYRLINPWKFIGNAGFLIGQYGFISAEYELQNLGNAKFKFKSNDADTKREQDSRNAEIANLYDWQHHIKIGAEVKLDPVRIRAGFQYKTSPFAEGGSAELIYSGGIGYRGKHFFVDGAYSYATNQTQYVPYEFGNITSGEATLDSKKSQVTITVGYKL